MVLESSPITSRTIRITKPKVNGLTVHDLHLSKYDGVNITRIFRAGLTLSLTTICICSSETASTASVQKEQWHAWLKLWAIKEKKLYHPNLVSIFLGIVVGIIFGSLPIAIPGLPVPLKLGLAGGPLIIAILLAYYGPNLRLITCIRPSLQNLMLRELGIALFPC